LAHQRIGEAEQARAEGLAAFGEVVTVTHVAIFIECRADIVPGGPGALAQLRVGGDLATERLTHVG
jgi:hypothetical protein